MLCRECGIELEKKMKTCPECGSVNGTSNTLFYKISKIEEILIASFLGIMVILVLIQVLLRNLFHTGIIGGDSIVKHLLLWIVFMGAGLATRDETHVRIDVVSKILSHKWKQVAEIIVTIFSVIVCCILVYASCSFVFVEYEAHGKLPFYNIPVWILEIIIPAGYLVVALRFASKGIINIINMIKGE